MSVSVTRSEVLNCSNPKLVFYHTVDGVLTNLNALSFTILEEDGLTEVQASTVVDIVSDCPTGDRLGTGRYTAEWTVGASQEYGRYIIRWVYQSTASSSSITVDEEFEVVSVAYPYVDGYAMVQDLRDEGFTTTDITDLRALKLIQMASVRIDRLLGRWFGPRYGTMVIDGRSSAALRFDVPVIAIGEVRIDTTSVDSTAYRVYNRHLSGLANPDDREDPKIVFYETAQNLPITLWSTSDWPIGAQNIEIDGVWGYTDAPGPKGSTPLDIREACLLMVIRRAALLSDVDGTDDNASRGYVTKIRTRDQEINWDAAARSKALTGGYKITGDPEVDALLLPYVKLGSMYSVIDPPAATGFRRSLT